MHNKTWLWLDDERDPTKFPWKDVPYLQNRRVIWCKTVDEAKQVALQEKIEWFSLDHDLGTVETGADFSKWLVERVMIEEWRPTNLKLQCHSMNPVGKKRIENDFATIELNV